MIFRQNTALEVEKFNDFMSSSLNIFVSLVREKGSAVFYYYDRYVHSAHPCPFFNMCVLFGTIRFYTMCEHIFIACDSTVFVVATN